MVLKLMAVAGITGHSTSSLPTAPGRFVQTCGQNSRTTTMDYLNGVTVLTPNQTPIAILTFDVGHVVRGIVRLAHNLSLPGMPIETRKWYLGT